MVPRWSDATSSLLAADTRPMPRSRTDPRDWRRSTAHAWSRKTGATDVDLVKSYDFAAAIQVLQGNDRRVPPLGASGPDNACQYTGIPFNNTLLILGAESSTFYQRVPVPIGMWQPFGKNGVPLRLNAPGVVRIDGQRAAVLICYEQILTYPILASMLQCPNILVGISNTFWFTGTPIPRYQANAVRAWADCLAFHI